MSVSKLFSRFMSPSEVDSSGKSQDVASTFKAVTSHPLIQFACVFSSIAHDIEHPGVPNIQLVKENAEVATKYKNKSIAEQNSLDVAWNLFMQDKYNSLRATIFSDEIELKLFRQLCVNSLIASDVMDKDLNALRNARWDHAFSENPSEMDPKDNVNRKATSEYLRIAVVLLAITYRMHAQRFLTILLFFSSRNRSLDSGLGRCPHNAALACLS